MGKKLCISAFLILTVTAAFWQVGNHEFLQYDDVQYVTENQHVQAGLTGAGVVWAFTTTLAGNWHPLTWISHMLDCQLYGLNPRGHHLTNLLLHLVNSLLLFLVLQRMTGAYWRSGFVAALFGLHPLHVESVAWVAERKDVLSTLFWMLTMWAYVRYTERPGISRYALALCTYALGLLAKPMLVSLPFVLLLLDYWPLGRIWLNLPTGDFRILDYIPARDRPQRSLILRPVWEKIPFFVLTVASCIVTFVVQHMAGATESIDLFPVKVRIANALVSYVDYIVKMLWPARLGAFYPHPGANLPMWQIFGATFLLIAISIVVMRAAKRYPYLAMGWLWYLGILVPVIGLVQVGGQAMADRYTYVPLVGLFVMISWGIADFLGDWRYGRIVLPVFAGLLISALMAITWFQMGKWRNSATLFEHTLRVTKNNNIMHNNLGGILTQQGRFAEAAVHYAKAIQIQPKHIKARNNLAVALVHLGKIDEAIVHYRKVLELAPNHAGAHNNLGNALIMQGKLDEGKAEFSAALEINPNYAEPHNNLGVILAREGRLNEAITHFSKALRINPSYVQAQKNLRLASQQAGKTNNITTPVSNP